MFQQAYVRSLTTKPKTCGMSIGPPVPEGTEGDGNKFPTKNDGWSTYPPTLTYPPQKEGFKKALFKGKQWLIRP